MPTPAAPLGPFDEAGLPRSKLGLLVAVHEALRSGDSDRLGALYIDDATMKARCQGDPPDTTTATPREAAATDFQRCVRLIDFAGAEAVAADVGSDIGHPPRSCGFEKHEAAKLYYFVGDELFRVTVRAFSYGGRHAMILPLSCDRSKKTRAEVLQQAQEAADHRSCPSLPWGIIWDAGDRCP